MFEYYKVKLSNKTNENSTGEPQGSGFQRAKIWKITTLLALVHSAFTVYAPTNGLMQLLAGVSMALLFVWLMIQLKPAPWKKITLKIACFALILLGAVLVLSIALGLIATATHSLMRPSASLGQVTNTVDMLTRAVILLVSPVAIVIFFRWIGEKPFRGKIPRKLYLELLIVLTIALILAQIPGALVLGSLNVTNLLQMLMLALINTLLMTTIITVCQQRGVLT